MAGAIFSEPVESYLQSLAIEGSPGSPVLRDMEAEAVTRKFPIVGPEVGRFFMQLAMLRRPKRILELGSGFGYSAIWWALGCPEAVIDCTELQQENIDSAMAYAGRAGVADRIHYHRGDAMTSARTLSPPWDIIFCDINKHEYVEALDFALPHLRPGDVLVYDNMLWHGNVVGEPSGWTHETTAVIETTRRIYADPRFRASLLPIRDGVLMAIRL